MAALAHCLRRFMRFDDSGSAIVEFSFVAPVFLVLLFSIIEFGRALFDYDAVANGARLGTRYAIVHGATCDDPFPTCTATGSGIQDYVRSKTTGLDTTNMSVNTSWNTSSVCFQTPIAPGSQFYPLRNGPGCTVTVTVAYQFQFVSLFTSPIPISSTSTMVISR